MIDPYNIALDCIDKHALSLDNKNKTALLAVQDGKPQATKLTFSQLAGLTNRMANAFKNIGIKKSDRILLRLPNAGEFPISFLGAIKLGALPVPSSPLYTWRELKYLLEDSGAVALVATKENLPEEIWREQPKSLKFILLVIEKEEVLPSGALRWQTLLKEADAKFNTEMSEANDPAFWLYTSGTTGEPKATIHAHRSIRAHDTRCRNWLNVREGDVIFNTSSLNWSYALTAGMLDPWRYGLTAVTYQGELSAEKIAEVVKRYGVSIFMSVPGLYRRLAPYLTEHPEAFGKVRTCLSAGENLLTETRNNFSKASGLEIYEGLGMTEHSVYVFQPSEETPMESSLGRPIDSQHIKILHEDLCECPANQTGILATHRDCPGLMLGYYTGKETLMLPTEGDWFLSGDLAHRDESGYFFFDGRRDELITAGGYRISPTEVETILNQHHGVEESAVIGRGEGDKTFIEAYVCLKINRVPSEDLEQEIQAFAKKSLAPFKVPRRIHFVTQLPKTITGKIKRSGL